MGEDRGGGLTFLLYPPILTFPRKGGRESSFNMPTWKTTSAKQTMDTGRSLGRTLEPGTVVAFFGDLGSGKTTMIKGLGLGLGIKNHRQIKSPTFVILHIYKGRVPLYHFDLYRMEHTADLDSLGLDEFLSDPKAVTVIEWAERLGDISKLAHLKIEIKRTKQDTRVIKLSKLKQSKNPRG